MKKIPIHQLNRRAALGLEVGHTSSAGKKEELETFGVHRDDNYLFLLIDKGHGSMVVDFVDIPLKKGELYFIAPGQLHFDIQTRNGEAWFLAAMPSLIPTDYREILEGRLLLQKPRPLGIGSKTTSLIRAKPGSGIAG
jgi:hypothetical protein